MREVERGRGSGLRPLFCWLAVGVLNQLKEEGCEVENSKIKPKKNLFPLFPSLSFHFIFIRRARTQPSAASPQSQRWFKQFKQPAAEKRSSATLTGRTVHDPLLSMKASANESGCSLMLLGGGGEACGVVLLLAGSIRVTMDALFFFHFL